MKPRTDLKFILRCDDPLTNLVSGFICGEVAQAGSSAQRLEMFIL